MSPRDDGRLLVVVYFISSLCSFPHFPPPSQHLLCVEAVTGGSLWIVGSNRSTAICWVSAQRQLFQRPIPRGRSREEIREICALHKRGIAGGISLRTVQRLKARGNLGSSAQSTWRSAEECKEKNSFQKTHTQKHSPGGISER